MASNANGKPFFSLNVSLLRILAVLGAVLGGILAAGLAALPVLVWVYGDTAPGFLLAFAIWGVGGVLVLELWARTRPQLPVSFQPTEEVKCLFPGAFPIILSRLVLAAAIWTIAVVVASPLRDIANQIGFPVGLLYTFPLWLMVFACVAAGIFLLWRAATSVYTLRCDTKVLTLRTLRKTIQFPFDASRFHRVCSPEGTMEGLLACGEGRSITFPNYSAKPSERAFLTALNEWMESQGVLVGDQRRLFPESLPRGIGIMGCEIGVLALCFFLTAGLVAALTFWVQWLLPGTSEFFLYQPYMMPVGFVAGILALLSPLRGWIWKLIRRDWARGVSIVDTLGVSISDAVGPENLWRSRSAAGNVRVRDDNLVLSLRSQAIRIPRDRVLRIEQWGFRQFADIPFIGRYHSKPIQLDWTTENGLIHSVLLVSRAGATFHRDLKIEEKLFHRLTAWWHTGEAPELQTLRRGRLKLFPAIAAAFLIAGCLGPPLHNFLLMHFVRTGAWSPPRWVQPDRPLLPAFLATKRALSPRHTLWKEDTIDDSSSFFLSPGTWIGDPFGGTVRLEGIPILNAVLSFPGPADYAFITDASMLSVSLVPPRAHPMPSKFPPQLLSIATGRATDLPFIPTPDVALYSNQRIFFVRQVDSQTSEVTVLRPEDTPGPVPVLSGEFPGALKPPEIGAASPTYGKNETTHSLKLHPVRESHLIPIMEPAWVDLASGTIHKLPRMAAQKDTPPLFFPDGWHVLYAWTVIDLHSGATKRVSLPAEAAGLKDLPPGIWNTFGGRNTLRMINLKDLQNGRRCCVWEIDPDTARMKLLDEFPPGTALVSADGDLWLLKKATRNAKISMLQPYNHAIHLYGPPSMVDRDSLGYLEAGTERILIYTPRKGWKIRQFTWD